MRISWNSEHRAFEAEFALGDAWAGDQQAAKDAGFKTQGPPAWAWRSTTIKPLNALKANRPQSGLTISEEALAKYLPMQKAFEENEAVLAVLKEKKKAQKKKIQAESHEGMTKVEVPEKGYIDEDDLPKYIPPDIRALAQIPPPDPNASKCISCGDILYFYEHAKFCLYCEKNILDKANAA